MNIRLSDHFTYKKLLRFTLPSIAMMVFTSIYGVVDGFFVSNFVGKTPFAAVNFIMPFLMILGTAGFMIGTGGSAIVARSMGEGDNRQANQHFSLFICAAIVISLILTVFGLIFLRPIAAWLGAQGEMLEQCVIYGRILLISLPAFILQMAFQSFLITAEKPQLGLIVTVGAGVTNMVLDALLVAVFPMGLVGAALASAISQAVGGLIPLIYFMCPNKSLLHLARPRFDARALVRCCVNGSSELMSNVSMSLVGMLYNMQLMKYVGENGVAAYGVMMYVNMIFLSIFGGYSIGTAPVISYHFGAANHKELQSLLKKSAVLMGLFAVAMTLLGEVMARPLATLFVGYDPSLTDMTAHGFAIYSLMFLFAGYAIFGSGFFTALNDGLTSALISFLRTLLFQSAAILLLPLIWGLDGIWISVVAAECMAVLVTLFFLIRKRRIYHYFG